MKFFLPVFAATAMIASTPALALQAQADPTEVAASEDGALEDELAEGDIFGALAGMFAAEPLTAEQEARLPLAASVVAKVMPEGAMGEMMSSMFDGFLGPLADLAVEPSAADVAETLGFESYMLDMSDEQAAEALVLIDPAWKERQEREAEVFPQMMAQMMDAMEPAMRKAMTELYAIHFTDAELTDIGAFFATPSGANYARKSFTMASDPRIVAASMEALPEMMGSITAMERQVEEATADLPPKRAFGDLGRKEQLRIAELTGYSVEEIEASVAASAELATMFEEGEAEAMPVE